MTREEIAEKVRRILSSQLASDQTNAEDGAYLTDLGADSIDLVEIVMAVEETFDMEIPDEEANTLSTVGKVVDYLVSKGV